jgi:hypothetical protein
MWHLYIHGLVLIANALRVLYAAHVTARPSRIGLLRGRVEQPCQGMVLATVPQWHDQERDRPCSRYFVHSLRFGFIFSLELVRPGGGRGQSLCRAYGGHLAVLHGRAGRRLPVPVGYGALVRHLSHALHARRLARPERALPVPHRELPGLGCQRDALRHLRLQSPLQRHPSANR